MATLATDFFAAADNVNGFVGQQPTISWGGTQIHTGGPFEWRLYYRVHDVGNWTLIDSVEITGAQSVDRDYVFTSDLIIGQEYDLYVMFWNGYHQFYSSFTITPAATAPTSHSPSSGYQAQSVEISWSGDANAQTYDVYWDVK